MNNPFFSIVMPTYNRAKFLPRSVKSVFQQRFTKWELIIVDDGSDDNTSDVANSFNDNKIRYYYQSNRGVSAARNLGIAKSRGNYICFLDDDDEFLETHLSYLHSNIVKEQYPVKLFCTNIFIRQNEKLTEHAFEDFSNTNSFNSLPWTPTVCIHHKILTKHLFNENLYQREDHELFDRIRRDFGIVTLNKRTIIINWHSENSTGDKFNHSKGMEECIYYYIKDRKRVSSEELVLLNKFYIYLFFKYYSDKNYKDSMLYLLKIILIMPFVIFCKKAFSQYKNIAGIIRNKIYSILND